jgi:hypothetical protein
VLKRNNIAHTYSATFTRYFAELLHSLPALREIVMPHLSQNELSLPASLLTGMATDGWMGRNRMGMARSRVPHAAKCGRHSLVLFCIEN